jgi:dihydrofolate reductase
VARLIYSMLASLDGYVADEQGDFSWATPDDEVHAYVNELERSVGTMLLGRRMYEVLAAWEDIPLEGEPAPIAEYKAIWLETDKVVFSGSGPEIRTGRTRLEPTFDADAVRAWKASADRDLSIGGPTLAAEALHAGLVDHIRLFLAPVIVGGGLRALPDGYRASLELVEQRRFEGGFVMLAYRTS